MNELDFHKKILQDPHHLDDELLAFLADSPEHQKSLKQVRELDQQIADTLAIEVPEGLQARILLKQSYQDMPAKQNKVEGQSDSKADQKSTGLLGSSAVLVWLAQPWSYASTALAATLLVAVMFLGLWQANQPLQPLTGDEMVAHILEHLEEDPEMMQPQAVAHSQQELEQLFASVGARLDGEIESMSYAGECIIEGQRGLHIVMQDKSGPVTVIVMPGPQIDAMQAFNRSGYMGELMPVKGGLVAIVGNSAQQLALAQIRFFKAVRFV